MQTRTRIQGLAFIVALATAGHAAAQITSNQTSAVPSDSPGAVTTEPTLAQNHNRGMGASSGATSGASETPATQGPAAAASAPKGKKAAKNAVKKQVAS